MMRPHAHHRAPVAARRRRRRALALLAGLATALGLALWSPPALGGGFGRSPALFELPLHPDLPLDAFAEGDLGVLQPSWARSYLVVAHRYLTDRPLDEAERGQALAFWTQRLGRAVAPSHWQRPLPIQGWMEARARVTGVVDRPETIDAYRLLPGAFHAFHNCLPDAFRHATRTLDARVALFGADHPGVIAWVEAQDAVFKHCSEPAAALPAPPTPDLPPLLAADRHYQRAAALFYAMRYDEARAAFLAIGADPDAPWRPLARYLAARLIWRQANLALHQATQDWPRHEALRARATRELRAIMADPSLASVHIITRRLLHKLSPPRRASPQPPPTLAHLGRDVADHGEPYFDVLEDATAIMDAAHSDTPRPHSLADLRAASPVADWVNALQRGEHAHALARWRDTGAPHWLLVALIHAGAADPASDALIDAAQAADPAHPAFPTLAHAAARLALGRGEHDRARALLAAWSPTADRPLTERNAHRALRAMAADSLEGLRDAALLDPVCDYRGPCPSHLYGASIDGHARPQAVSTLVARTLNSITPLRQLIALAELSATGWPAPAHADLVLSAWTRAVLLERHDAARRLIPLLEALDLTPYPALRAWITLPDPDSPRARDLATLTLLRHPRGLSPLVTDHDAGDVHTSLRPRPWRPPQHHDLPPTAWDPLCSVPLRVFAQPPRPGWLSPADLAEARDELAFIAHPPFSPDEARVREAAVRAHPLPHAASAAAPTHQGVWMMLEDPHALIERLATRVLRDLDRHPAHPDALEALGRVAHLERARLQRCGFRSPTALRSPAAREAIARLRALDPDSPWLTFDGPLGQHP